MPARSSPAPNHADLLEVLKQRFGHPSFRPGQERIVRALLGGRDTLAVLPTGAGKSLVYQLAAQLLPGLTLVVSPLLALMKDQVESLEARGVRVAVINSTQAASEAEQALRAAIEGDTKLLYVTPERFDDAEFVAQVRRLEVSLFVVDEAHSISEWGHSFRPSYLTLPTAIAQVGRPTLLALTATATPWVRDDIVTRLGLREPELVVTGTDRPNLFLEVVRVEEEREDRRVLQDLLCGSDAPMQGSGIVYTATTRAASETAAWLRDWGITADVYHGQRRKRDREQVQEAFMSGELRVIAATNAFGLGVDKPDVRFVIHRDIPASLEAYYQEAGRAGRDAEPARCTLIYRPGDLGQAAFLAGGGELTREEVVRAREGLVRTGGGTLRELEAICELGRADLARLVEILVDEGLAEQRRGRVRLRVEDFDPEQLPLERETHRRAYERSRLEMMRAYAELRECRRRYLLNYFGEDPEWQRCGRCDVDLRADAPAEVPEGPYGVNDRVVHPSLGEGVVQHVAADTLTVLFEQAGYKTLGLELVQEQELLRKIS
jgi:ATP-dependent DNA helicase RecQ